jgi:hypothetical protein
VFDTLGSGYAGEDFVNKFNALFQPKRVAAALFAGLFAAHTATAAEIAPPVEEILKARLLDFSQNKSRTLREFQPFRASVNAESAAGVELTLTSLNPYVGSWFLLDVSMPDRRARRETYHLELADPEGTRLTLNLARSLRLYSRQKQARTAAPHGLGLSLSRPAIPRCPMFPSATSVLSCATKCAATARAKRRWPNSCATTWCSAKALWA